MTAVRQDAWSADDDLILAEVTLRHIREGGTQLRAFEEVGERIGRTAAACGFRWNSCVRKKYEAAIQIAKNQRKERNKLKKKNIASNQPEEALTSSITLEDSGYKNESAGLEEQLSIDAIIRFLRRLKTIQQDSDKRIKQLERELREKNEELEKLRNENEKLAKEVKEVQIDYRTVNDDYKALIQIMDRARKLAFLGDDEENGKPRFKMDANGNLERVE